MSANYLPPAVTAALVTLILSGCASADLARIDTAARRQGVAAAGVTLPSLPSDCRAVEPHAPIYAGAEVRSVLKRERAALDRANGRVRRCAGFHDDLIDHLQNRIPE